MSAPLLLLHPFPFDSTFWDGARPHLGGIDVTTHDAPGFGGRPVPIGWQIADWADDVAEVIAALPGGRAVVCGLSMGGYAALALVARHLEVVAGLVLADTRAEADGPEARERRDAGIARIAEGDMAGWVDDLLPQVISPHADDGVRAALRMQMLRQDPSCVCEALRALRDRPDRTADLGAITAPTLVVLGSDDVVTPAAAAATLVDGIPGAEGVSIPGAGHLSAAEKPAEFGALVAPFVRGIS